MALFPDTLCVFSNCALCTISKSTVSKCLSTIAGLESRRPRNTWGKQRQLLRMGARRAFRVSKQLAKVCRMWWAGAMLGSQAQIWSLLLHVRLPRAHQVAHRHLGQVASFSPCVGQWTNYLVQPLLLWMSRCQTIRGNRVVQPVGHWHAQSAKSCTTIHLRCLS